MVNLPRSLTTVTPFSKLLAGFLFILLPIAAFFAGMNYQTMIDLTKYQQDNLVTNRPSPTPVDTSKPIDDDLNQVVCTQEAKLCPDGKTYVSRTGPNCEFALCPENDPCIDQGKLEVWYSQPFNDKTMEEAKNYFSANGLKIILLPQTGTAFVIEIPSNSSGEYWINKFRQDGFGKVNYLRIVGCDIVQ